MKYFRRFANKVLVRDTLSLSAALVQAVQKCPQA